VDRTRAGRVEMPAIPNKLYFRIGEVSDLVGVKPYVLRYWESEFTDIKPSKSKSGQRLYKRRDVELLLKIKELLYEERFTINGARKRLKDFSRTEAREPDAVPETGDYEEAEEVGDGPEQLEVFGVSAEHGDDQAHKNEDDALRPRSQAPGRDNTKALLKIRRDLEELLHMMKP